MPERVTPQPTPLTSVAGKHAANYQPLPQDIQHGVVRAHAIQTIDSDPQTLYAMWSDLANIPHWQEYVVSVTPTGNRTSHWVMVDPTDPEGKRFEFDSELVEDVPGSTLAWRSTTKDFDQSGKVTFAKAENGRGTVVTLEQHSPVPGGALGNIIAGMAKRTPRQIVIEDLRHFKQMAEAGEIPSVVGQANGPRGFSGSLKAHLYGENNPTPAGTSDL